MTNIGWKFLPLQQWRISSIILRYISVTLLKFLARNLFQHIQVSTEFISSLPSHPNLLHPQDINWGDKPVSGKEDKLVTNIRWVTEALLSCCKSLAAAATGQGRIVLSTSKSLPHPDTKSVGKLLMTKYSKFYLFVGIVRPTKYT